MIIQSQDQLDAFKAVATQQGYSPEEVDSFMKLATTANDSKKVAADQAQTDELKMYGDKLKLQQQYSTTQPGDLTDLEKQAISGGTAKVAFDPLTKSYKVMPTTPATDPMQYVADNQATKYLTGKDKDARNAQAAAIQKLGVDGYLKSSALPDLLTEKEQTARDATTALLNSASAIYSEVQDQNGKPKDVQGVGILGQLRPGFLTNTEGKTLKQDITSLTAEKMREISGAAVSDKEVQRLSKALPQVGDPESVIFTKAKNIADSLEIGLQMQELAKRERLTLDQAYMKYGAQAFQDHAQPIPAWIKGGSQPGLTDIGNEGIKVGKFNIQVH